MTLEQLIAYLRMSDIRALVIFDCFQKNWWWQKGYKTPK